MNKLKQYGIDSENLDKDVSNILPITLTKYTAKLKYLQHVEVEYIEQTCKNGIAVTLFERLLEQPASGGWKALAHDLINVLRLWLDAVSKKVSVKVDHWWHFLQRILKCVTKISTKYASIPDILAECMTPSLLELSCGNTLSPQQCHSVLQCVNMYCAVSSRDARRTYRDKVDHYFPKLAKLLVSTGHFPSQFAALETIVRWIVPRNESNLRAAVATFPRLNQTASHVFVHATWNNFTQDAREFLNAINEDTGLVTSVMCKKISAGDVELCADVGKLTWFDINTSDGTISVILDTRALLRLANIETTSWEVLVMDVTAVTLRSDAPDATISLKTTQPPRVLPSGLSVGTGCDVTIIVGSRTNLQALHDALHKVYGDKYQMTNLGLDTVASCLPAPSPDSRKNYNSPAFLMPSTKSRKNIRYGDCVLNTSPPSSSVSSARELRVMLPRLPLTEYVNEKFPKIVDRDRFGDLSDIGESRESHHFGDFLIPRGANSDPETRRRTREPSREPLTTDIVSQLALEAQNADILKRQVATEFVANKPQQKERSQAKNTVSKKKCTVISATEDEYESNTDIINETPFVSLMNRHSEQDNLQILDKKRNTISPTSREMNRSTVSETREIVEQPIKKSNMPRKYSTDTEKAGRVTKRKTSDICSNFYTYMAEHEDSLTREEPPTAKTKKKAPPKKSNKKTEPVIRPRRNLNPSCKAKENAASASTPKKNPAAKRTRQNSQNDITWASPEPLNLEETEKDADNKVQGKRKRKLYSPKDDDNDADDPQNSDGNDACHVTSKQKTRKTANKEIVAQTQKILLSPKTLEKNSLFDQLRSIKENDEKIKQVSPNKNTDVYNYTSDSEDEQFAAKKILLKRRLSTDVNNTEPAPKTRGVKKAAVKKTKGKKPAAKPASNSGKAKNIEEEMADEQMRQANTDVIDNSFVISDEKETHRKRTAKDITPPRTVPYSLDDLIIEKRKEYADDSITDLENFKMSRQGADVNMSPDVSDAEDSTFRLITEIDEKQIEPEKSASAGSKSRTVPSENRNVSVSPDHLENMEIDPIFEPTDTALVNSPKPREPKKINLKPKPAHLNRIEENVETPCSVCETRKSLYERPSDLEPMPSTSKDESYVTQRQRKESPIRLNISEAMSVSSCDSWLQANTQVDEDDPVSLMIEKTQKIMTYYENNEKNKPDLFYKLGQQNLENHRELDNLTQAFLRKLRKMYCSYDKIFSDFMRRCTEKDESFIKELREKSRVDGETVHENILSVLKFLTEEKRKQEENKP